LEGKSPRVTAPNAEEAIDDGLRNGGGDVFSDAVIYQCSWYIPFIYGQSGWKIVGDVVKTRKK
jgi:hypothetical protein